MSTEPPPSIPTRRDTIVVCDERPVTRRVLSRLLRAASATQVVCVGGGTALLPVVTAGKVGVVLIGVHGGSTSGLTALALVVQAVPSAAAVVFGGRGDAAALTTAVSRGACGVMIWEHDYPVAAPGILRVGGRTRPRPPVDGHRRLTPAELQVLRGMSHGQSNREIAGKLFLSHEMVKSLARRLFGKIGARDRAHAVAVGLRAGLL